MQNKQKIASIIIFCLSSAAIAVSLFLRLTLDMKPCTTCNQLAILTLIIYVASVMTIPSGKSSRRMRLLPLILCASFLGALISGSAYSSLGCVSCGTQFQGIGFMGFSIYLYALGYNSIVFLLSITNLRSVTFTPARNSMFLELKPIVVTSLSFLLISSTFIPMFSFGYPSVSDSIDAQINPNVLSDPISTTTTPEDNSIDALIDDSLENGRPVFLFFYTDWCGYCTKQKPIVDELEEEYGEDIEFLRVDAEEHRDAVKDFGVTGFPAMFLISEKGDDGGYVQQEFRGYTEKETLSQYFISIRYTHQLDVDNDLTRPNEEMYQNKIEYIVDQFSDVEPYSWNDEDFAHVDYDSSIQSTVALERTWAEFTTWFSPSIVQSGSCPGECTPGETTSASCGNCGTMQGICTANCEWSWDPCTGEGICSPGSTTSCSVGGLPGEATCTESCVWGTCDPYEVCGDTITEDTVLKADLPNCQTVGLIIGSDHITLDCDGHSIMAIFSTATAGISVPIERRNVTIKNCHIEAFQRGINAEYDIHQLNLSKNILISNQIGVYLDATKNSSMGNNVFINNGETDMFILGSDRNRIANNVFTGSPTAIKIRHTRNTKIDSNRFIGNTRSLWLYYTIENNQLIRNVFENCTYGIDTIPDSFEYNEVYLNYFINSDVLHTMDSVLGLEQWNGTGIGNYWYDFESNPGYPNHYEIDMYGTDWHPIANPDPDGDGIWDYEDNCPSSFNPEQRESDGSCVGFYFKWCDSITNHIACKDSPGCHWISDGYGNACDNCPNQKNADQADKDGDGHGDACDNCPSHPNASQEDTDDDGIGDLCDPETCGNGILEGTEECDDGNQLDGDGCSATCESECVPEPEVCDGLDNDCDGVIDNGGDTLCDNGISCDGQELCTPTGCERGYSWCLDDPGVPQCKRRYCDGEICATEPDPEAEGMPCDDGNPFTTDDVCVAGSCQGTPVPQECGNGNLEEPEECDDGNLVDGDGCSAECVIEYITISSCGSWGVSLSESGMTYVLDQDITCPRNGFFLFNDVTLDCRGHLIMGSWTSESYGVKASSLGYTIKNCTIKNFIYGIRLYSAEYGLVLNNTVYDNWYGISLDYSDNATLESNKVFSNIRGVSLYYSYNNTMTSNHVHQNELGFLLDLSDNNTIELNLVELNSLKGLHFRYSNLNMIVNNTIQYNDEVGVRIYGSDNNVLKSNVIENNKIGADVSSGNENIFYNNLFNNAENAHSTIGNSWNTTKIEGTNVIGGPYIGGNFWSDYEGNDLEGDLIGDTQVPYDSGGNITGQGDYHPLVYYTDSDEDGDPNATDCAPLDPTISNLVPENCIDGIDNDCDGDTDWNDYDCYTLDTDGDGVPDMDDPTPTDPYVCGDSDSDTCDDCSVTGIFDPGNDGPDADNDGLCNDFETDDDNDGVLDVDDNCPLILNPLQEDLDEDGLGDVCDPQTCGNDITEPPEECDDGNFVDGDGCSAACSSEHIYKSDCSPIESPGTYLLTGDILCFTSGLYIMSEDVKLDCQGHAILGPSNIDGITSGNSHISNCVLDNLNKGIVILSMQGAQLINNTVTRCNYGIYFSATSYNNISHNKLHDNNYGIYFANSEYNNIATNNITGSLDTGIKFDNSNWNLIFDNYLDNTVNVYDYGNNDWNVTRQLGANIIGGLYLGGNYWNDYLGYDTSGDGLGDTLLPYRNGIYSGMAGRPYGDYHPLTTRYELDTDEDGIVDIEDNCIFHQNTNQSDIDEDGLGDVCDTQTCGNWIREPPEECDHGVGGGGGCTEECTKEVIQLTDCSDRLLDQSAIYVLANDVQCNEGFWMKHEATLDCQGHSITGLGSNVGVDISYPYNVTVKNCVIQNFSYAMSLFYANNSVIIDNEMYNNSYGISIDYSHHNTFTSNSMDNKYGEIFLSQSHYNTFDSNSLKNNRDTAVSLISSSWNHFISNVIDNNTFGLKLMSSSDNNRFMSNSISNSTQSCFSFHNSDNSELDSNTVEDCGYNGLYFDHSTNNIFSSNTISGCGAAVTDPYYSIGCMNFSYSQSNTLTSNTVQDSIRYGIAFYESDDNTLTSNIIIGNVEAGLKFENSDNSLIYDNYFDNTVNALDNGYNYWNSTKRVGTNIIGDLYIGGNYWSDYIGYDTTGDFLGDDNLPYNNGIDNGGDYLPLAQPAVTSVSCGQALPSGITYLGDDLTCSGNALIIDKDDTVLDCNGHFITGDGIGIGINIGIYPTVRVDRAWIRNCVIRNFETGIMLKHARSSLIDGNTITENYDGVYITDFSYSNITSNNITYNDNSGIEINSGYFLRIHSNWFLNNYFGIYTRGYDNAIYNNHFENPTGIDAIQSGLYSSSYWEMTDDDSLWYYDEMQGPNIVGGPTIGGNYWHDFVEVDNDGDGFADNSYSNNGVWDRKPLVQFCGINIYKNTELTEDLVFDRLSHGIIFLANDTTLDCRGHVIKSTAPKLSTRSGVLMNGRSGVTVKNCIIEGFTNGVYLIDSDNNTFESNVIQDNFNGMYFYNSKFNTVKKNIIEDNSNYGAAFYSSSYGNLLYDNWFNNTEYHLNNILSGDGNKWNTTITPGTNIVGGSFIGGNYWNDYEGKDLTGDFIGDTDLPHGSGGYDYLPLVIPPECYSTLDKSVTLNRDYYCPIDQINPVSTYAFKINTDNVVFDCNNHEIRGNGNWTGISVDADNVTIKNCEVIGFQTGIFMRYQYGSLINNTVRNNTNPDIYNPGCGIKVVSDHVYLDSNLVCDNNDGVIFLVSSYNTFISNEVRDNSLDGLFISKSTGNNLISNKIHRNYVGIDLNKVNETSLDSNIIHDNLRYGVKMSSSYNNTVTSNDFIGNVFTIYSTLSSDNLIYNNIFNGTSYVIDHFGYNHWNTTKTSAAPNTNIVGGPFIGGNYWYKYEGVDNTGDWLGDTLLPYNCSDGIDNGGDYLPLIIPVYEDSDNDGYMNNVDCNDADDTVYPGADDSTCNGIDNDCDGIADDDYSSSYTIYCGTGACMALGSEECVDGSIVQVCNPSVPAIDDHTCDGIDDDCDGLTDEDYVSEGVIIGVGACSVFAYTYCSGGDIKYTSEPNPPLAEDDVTCDGVDDDCDGLTDEDCVTCTDNDGDGYGTGSACLGPDCDDGNPFINPGTDDSNCDNIDDDCDTIADDDYISTPTNCGVGECAATGSLICLDGVETDTCTEGTPSAEICDGLDNDCDDVVDNGGDMLCYDTIWCNGQETCGGFDGCQAGTPPDCDDGVSCTDDSCNEDMDSCDNIPNDAHCPANDWFDVGAPYWVDVQPCDREQRQDQEYRDFYCDASLSCQYAITDTKYLVLAYEDYDADDDSVCDDIDNCPLTSNIDQSNVDSQDGGDVCDICPSDETDTCNTDYTGSGVIGADGGSVITSDGTTSIDIPEGALDQETSISITEEGTSYELTVNLGEAFAHIAVDINPEGTQFNMPITITFTWDDENNNGLIDQTEGSDPEIHEKNLIITKDSVAISGRCHQDPGCDMAANTFSVEVDSLSVFALAYLYPDTDADGVQDPFDNCPSVYNPPSPTPGNPSDDFSGPDLDTTKWGTTIGEGTATIEKGRLKITIPVTSTGGPAGGIMVNSRNLWELTGDFEYQVDIDTSEIDSTSHTNTGMRVYCDGTTSYYFGYQKNNRFLFTWSETDPSWTLYGEYGGYTETNYTIRLVRSGSTLTAFYLSGSNWVVFHQIEHASTGSCILYPAEHYPGSDGSLVGSIAYFDNAIVSGETTYETFQQEDIECLMVQPSAKIGETITIQGTMYHPEATVWIHLRNPNLEEESYEWLVDTDQTGSFTLSATVPEVEFLPYYLIESGTEDDRYTSSGFLVLPIAGFTYRSVTSGDTINENTVVTGFNKIEGAPIGINITADNITLICESPDIVLEGTYALTIGINAPDVNNVSIYGCNIKYCGVGIRLARTSDCVIEHCVITDTVSGIDMGQLGGTGIIDNNVVYHNDFERVEYGVSAYPSTNTEIKYNSFKEVKYGVYIRSSENAVISKNVFDGINKPYGSWGISIDDYSFNNSVYKNTISNLGYGVRILYSNDNVITRNYINNTVTAVQIAFTSQNNRVKYNTMKHSSYGIYVSGPYNNIGYNDIMYNIQEGIRIEYADHIKVLNNNIINNTGKGIMMQSGSGFHIVKNNTIDNNGQIGISLGLEPDTIIANNNITNHDIGLRFGQALIYNNFISNTVNTDQCGENTFYVEPETGPNIIGGPYIGGNYWNDYTGSDENSDGFGDIPYDYNGVHDEYPLVHLSVEPPTGLVSWWPGDENAYDIVGGNHGTLLNGATSAPGKVGQAFSFDGVDDYIWAPSTGIDELQQLTIETWVKIDSLGEGPHRFVYLEGEKACLCHVGEGENHLLHFYMNFGGPPWLNEEDMHHIWLDHALVEDVWYHVAGTYDGSHMRLYQNGELVGVHEVSGTLFSMNGVFLSQEGESFDGLLDEVSIYDRALTPEEIRTIYYTDSVGKNKPYPLFGETVTFNTVLTHDLINCPEDGLIVGADGITIDGDGHKLIGTGTGSGIFLNGYSGVTVTNFHIEGFETGVNIQNGNSNTIKVNYITKNYVGIQLSSATGNRINNNIISENQIGVSTTTISVNNQIYANLIINNIDQTQDLGENLWYHSLDYIGNFWSNYWGEDLDYDGIGDTDLPHEGDYHPLLDPTISYQYDPLPFGGDWWNSLTWVMVWRGGWSPVEIVASDPLGQMISQEVNEIGYDAFYVEDLEWEPGTKKVMVIIATSPLETENWGEYSLQMTALEDLTYSMEWFASQLGEIQFYHSVEEEGLFAGESELAAIILVETVDPHTGEIIVEIESPPLAIIGGPYVADEMSFVIFDASGSNDPDGDPLQYRWDFENDGTWDTGWSTEPTTHYTLNDDYTGSIKVEVSDGTLSDIDTTSYCFTNVAPSVDAGLDQTVAEGDVVIFNGAFTDPSTEDTHTYEWDFGDAHGSSDTLTPNHAYGDNGIYTVTLTVTDDDDGVGTDTLTVIVDNVSPDVGPIAAPLDPIAVSTSITASADFTDPGILDTHTAVWDWGDGTTLGTVTESDGSGSVSDSHSYATPGVYTIILTVTDDDGGSGFSTYQYVVVYDPDGGFVTGGGWIDSPLDAYVPDPTLTGKATFGFVAKFKKGTNIPTGKTEFVFHVADINFHSDVYQWLVIAGPRAQFKGTGTINGEGEYSFMLTAIDGQIPGGLDTDKFRIKIWEIGGDIVYDNQLGDADDANATTELGGGSIVIHNK